MRILCVIHLVSLSLSLSHIHTYTHAHSYYLIRCTESYTILYRYSYNLSECRGCYSTLVSCKSITVTNNVMYVFELTFLLTFCLYLIFVSNRHLKFSIRLRNLCLVIWNIIQWLLLAEHSHQTLSQAPTQPFKILEILNNIGYPTIRYQ